MAVRENYDDGKVINGTTSADSIVNHGGNNVSINADKGNDSIVNWSGSNVIIYCGDDNDTVGNWGKNGENQAE